MQQKRKKTIIAPKEIKHPITLRSNGIDHLVFKQIFVNGEYDMNLDFEPKFIIDGGANIGLFSVLFANRYPNAKIIAVEPEKENFELAVLNTKRYPNVSVIQSGIWNKSTHLEVVVEGLSPWSFQVKESPKSCNTISSISISDLLEKSDDGIIDIVKLDVEGSEKNIFLENFDWLKKARILIIELHEQFFPGSSLPFQKAIANYNFTNFRIGENIICRNNCL